MAKTYRKLFLFVGTVTLLAVSSIYFSKPVLAVPLPIATQQSVLAEASAYGLAALYPDGLVTNFASSVTLDKKGTASIVEKITVYFPQQRHGIYRWIPNEVIIKDTGKKLKQPISVSSVSYKKLPSTADSVGSLSGGPAYTSSTSSGNYTVLKIGEADTLISGAYEYTIAYTMKRAVRFQKGYRELYLNITGDQWEIPILKASAVVSPATGIADSKCFTGASGATASNCTINTSGNYFSLATATAPTVLAEGLTVAIKYADNTFAPPSALERFIEQILPLLPLLLPVFVFLYGYSTWKKYGRDTSLYAVPPVFVPTNQMEQENLTILNGLLVMKGTPVATTAELIRLAEKGYLTISYENGKVSLRLSPEQQKKLPEFLATQPKSLQTLISTLTRDFQPDTAISSLKSVYTDIANANKQAVAEFKNCTYITDKSENIQSAFIAFSVISFIGAFLLFAFLSESSINNWAILPISLLICGVFFTVFAIGMLKRNKEGDQLYLDLHGLKKYIKTAEVKRLEFFNNPQKMIAHFEQILPYAVILKLDKQWTKEFGPILEQLEYAPTWMTSNVPIYQALPHTYAAMSNQISTSMAKIGTPPSSSGSSFGGGGGGFSGGGSGGGGGGSW